MAADDLLDIATLLRPVPGDTPGRFTLEVPDGLQQGRGAWGGIATGAITSAAQQADPRPQMAVRSVSAQLVAPLLVGRANIIVEELRRGSATNTMSVRVVDDGGALVAHGAVVLGAPRVGDEIPDGPRWSQHEPPAELARGPESVPVVPLGPPLAPRFLRQLELRPIQGLPFTGSRDPASTGWVRPAGAVSRLDAPLVVALADAWWVAAMAMVDRPRPVGTLAFTVDLPCDPSTLPLEADGRLRPLFHRGRNLAVRAGYVVEARELWTQDGRLVSWNTQTVAFIK